MRYQQVRAYMGSWRGSRLCAWVMASNVVIQMVIGEYIDALLAISGTLGWMLAADYQRAAPRSGDAPCPRTKRQAPGFSPG